MNLREINRNQSQDLLMRFECYLALFLFIHLCLQNKKIVLVSGLETETVKISVSVMSCEKYVFSIELYF